MPTSLTGRISKQRGVTLIEMVVVVGIVGLIAAVSFPTASAGLDSIRLSSASGSVAAFLNAAVNRAERRQMAVEVAILAKENKLALYSNEPGYTRELKMPDGVAIEGVITGKTGVDARDTENGPYRLLLLPGAATPGIGIQLVNKHGSRRIVRLDPMTGFPRVEVVAAK